MAHAAVIKLIILIMRQKCSITYTHFPHRGAQASRSPPQYELCASSLSLRASAHRYTDHIAGSPSRRGVAASFSNDS